MGRTSSITLEQEKTLVDAMKRLGNKEAAAREAGVSRDAAVRYFKKLAANSAPILHQAHIVEAAGVSLWDTRTALDANFDRILELVRKLETGIIETDGEYSSQTPISVHIAALKEVREHIKTSMSLMQLLISVDEARKFQSSVIEAIGEADEPTRQRLLAKLRARRALGPTLLGA